MMSKIRKQFFLGDRVFAKVRGYPPWPARIQEVFNQGTKQEKYHVFFYGTYERGVTKVEELFDYEKNKAKMGNLKRKFFSEAMREIEETPEIDGPISARPPPKITIKIPKNIRKAVEESDEEDKLVIDETIKAKKRKLAEVSDEPTAKKRKQTVCLKAPVATTENEPIHVSRSGRKIKPKKFDDDFSEPHISKSLRLSSEMDDAKFVPMVQQGNIDEEDIKSCQHGSSVESIVKLGSNEEWSRSTRNSENESKNSRTSAYRAVPNATTYEKETKQVSQQPVRSHLKMIEPDSQGTKRLETLPLHATTESANQEVTTSNKAKDSVQLSNSEIKRESTYYKIHEPVSLTITTKGGENVNVIFDENLPVSFLHKSARLQWNMSAARKFLMSDTTTLGDVECRLKYKLANNLSRLDKENTLKSEPKERESEQKIISWLTKEKNILSLHNEIVECLKADSDIDVSRCLNLMEKLLKAPVEPFMLVKNPHVVISVRKCMRFCKRSSIRRKAGQLFDRYKSLFNAKEDRLFWNIYSKKVQEFSEKTETLTEHKRVQLIELPAEHSCNRELEDRMVIKKKNLLEN